MIARRLLLSGGPGAMTKMHGSYSMTQIAVAAVSLVFSMRIPLDIPLAICCCLLRSAASGPWEKIASDAS